MIYSGLCLEWGLPDRARTCDPLIKSQLLYQLSYGEVWGCKIRNNRRIVKGLNENLFILKRI